MKKSKVTKKSKKETTTEIEEPVKNKKSLSSRFRCSCGVEVVIESDDAKHHLQNKCSNCSK